MHTFSTPYDRSHQALGNTESGCTRPRAICPARTSDHDSRAGLDGTRPHEALPRLRREDPARADRIRTGHARPTHGPPPRHLSRALARRADSAGMVEAFSATNLTRGERHTIQRDVGAHRPGAEPRGPGRGPAVPAPFPPATGRADGLPAVEHGRQTDRTPPRFPRQSVRTLSDATWGRRGRLGMGRLSGVD